ncbi:MAG: putative transcriptional regulator, TetR family [Acidobacteria bacterium]|nr:putative transcriptional regulator, TetR family [Acidobacteriota bacterium]
MSTRTRTYRSDSRRAKAALNRKRILTAAQKAFSRRGFDEVTIGGVAALAGVSAALVYALFKSKEGLLRALIDTRVFGPDYVSLVEKLTAQTDPVDVLNTAARITRSIYESERRETGSILRMGIVSAGVRRLEHNLEHQRYERQELVVRRLFDMAAIRPGLSVTEARDILWSLTTGELYRLLVIERKWTDDDYEAWLGGVLAAALLNSGGRGPGRDR